MTPSSGALNIRREAPGALMLRSMRSLRKTMPPASHQAKQGAEGDVQNRLGLIRLLGGVLASTMRMGFTGTELLRFASLCCTSSV